MDEVDIGWNWDADAKQNQGASCNDGDYKATDFGGNPQRTHGGRIRERLKGERSSRKQKEGLPALSPRASNAPLEDAENQLPAGPAGTATKDQGGECGNRCDYTTHKSASLPASVVGR